MRKEFVAPEINTVDIMPSESIMLNILKSANSNNKFTYTTTINTDVADQYEMWKGTDAWI